MRLLDVKKKLSVNRVAYFVAVFAAIMLAAAPSALATTPGIVTGGVNLARDALTWVLLLVPVTAGVMVAYHAWMKSMADGEPGAIAERNKKMKNVFIGAVIAECASGLVLLVLSYF